MAQEPWNKIHIPFPSAFSSSRIPFTDSNDLLIESLLTDCEKVLTLLSSEVLQTEIRVLYELLHVLNNSFRQHKPFRALKQVEQCVNRLKEMKLKEAVEDLKELCPNKFQRDAGAEVGECDLPSQPMLEWLCLKLLGASSLLARTLERCTQAFMLARQHILLSEFIVLNVVITSMLSRLWVFFRGILKALIPMYKGTTELLQEVSRSQPMPYLTDFTLPRGLKDFLCLSYPDLLLEEGTKDPLRGKKGKKNISLLSRLFESKGREEESEMMPVVAAVFVKGSSLDMGAAVLQRRPGYSDLLPCGLDIKFVLQKSCKSTKQMSLEPEMKTDITSQAAGFQMRKFLKSLRKVSSFRNMAVHLKKMIHLCRSCKFHQVRKYLAFLHLKCLRMESLEAEGVRVEKRLKTFKCTVQKALTPQKTLRKKHSFSIMTRNRTARCRSVSSRKCSRPVKDRPQQESPKKEVLGNNKLPGAEEKIDSEAALQKPNMLNDDIDNIFESFGF
ncbi:LOW QUALITY PROTEIN: nucleolus and neural progenitor protein [Puntigrus tetrazona]|uniref:LOW QUALITY PROTEIN: nucleolus and neural progenitor protein n=1 Tax=Puntigrus tetrazona TaxID=1606681 RepID=UPI001C894843|nr:LOW QUALITY PROTEIN: nucleolus and neural progenitor protein [Puntigrus tetrazona]